MGHLRIQVFKVVTLCARETTHQTTQNSFAEDLHPQQHCCVSLKTHALVTCYTYSVVLTSKECNGFFLFVSTTM